MNRYFKVPGAEPKKTGKKESLAKEMYIVMVQNV